MTEPLGAIVSVAKEVLERTPPELVSDVIDRGMVMTGGGALLRNLDKLLIQETGVPCYPAENPIACVAVGAGLALENYDIIRRTLPSL
jgi:rod shape-determining protein MreB